MARQFTINTVSDILNCTFEKLDRIYRKEECGSMLIFPEYSNGGIRVSEQELRFMFIEELCRREWTVHYSVETPTKLKYRFSPDESGRPVPRVASDEDLRDHIKTESAQFDTVLHREDGTRMCLIEFKGKLAGYQKDFLKLNSEMEEDCPGFFVEILKDEDKGTVKSIESKIRPLLGGVIYVCHILETGNTYCMSNVEVSELVDEYGWKRI